jgi:catecholate siderophore receptor
MKKHKSAPTFRLSPIATAIALSLGLPSAGWAQQPEAESTPPAGAGGEAEPSTEGFEPPSAGATELPTVTVEGIAHDSNFVPDTTNITGGALRDLPQTATVITRPVMDSQAAASVKDALRYVPGITLSAGEGGQIGDNINLRGFSARTDVYVDGFRDRGQYSRDVFFLDAVEVLKGPSSMLFGRGSTGGVINQVSKAANTAERTELSTTTGSDGYHRATADLNRPFGDGMAARVALMAQDVESTRDVVVNRDFGIAPSLRLGIGSPTELSFSALFQRNDDLPDYGFPLLTENGAGTVAKPVNAPADSFYGYADDRFEQEVGQLATLLTHQLGDQLTLRARVQYAHYTTNASPTPLTVPTGPGQPTRQTPLDQINLVRQDRDREIDDSSLFGQTELVGRFRSNGVAYAITGGLEVGVDRFRNEGYGYDRPPPPTPADDPTLINLADPINGTRSGTRYLSARTRTTGDTAATYVNVQADIGSAWKAVAGLRYDEFTADSSVINYAADGTPTVPAQPAQNTDRMLSPRAGLLFQPTAQASYYVSYGTSFNPSAEAVTQSSGNNAPNASLDPEENRSYELGAKWSLSDGDLELAAALFRVDKTNARYNDPAVGGLQSNSGEARVQGVELSAVGRVTEAWQVIGGYNWLDSEILESPEIGTNNNAGIAAEGKRFPNTPEHYATLWNAFQLPLGFEAGAGAVYMSDRTLNNFETAKTDGYLRADAMLGFQRPSWGLRLNLLNVTDELYFETALGGRATPARGRSLLLNATWRFAG